MRIQDLFESDDEGTGKLRLDLSAHKTIKLKGFGGGGITNVQRFLQDFEDATQESPFNHRQRVYGQAIIELSPSIDDRANGIHIGDIVGPGGGEGTRAMQFVCDLADKHHVFIELTARGYPINNPKTPTEVLVNWYMRFGFQPQDDWQEWIDEGVEMIRPAKP